MPLEVAPPKSREQTWRDRIRIAQEAQREEHGVWASNLAFAAGQHWLVWDTKRRQLRHIRDKDPRYKDRELYTADRITEHRRAALGEMSSDEDRPQLLVAQEGEDAEQVADELNYLTAYAWDKEWHAAAAIAQARAYCLDVGVAAIRARWDPNAGPLAGYLLLDENGQPVEGELPEGTLENGNLPTPRTVREGRTRLEAYSAFQILPPPGVAHEDAFPWEILVRPVLIEDIEDVYGVKVREDTDIVSTAGLVGAAATQAGQKTSARLHDHAWFYTCFQRPTHREPDGHVAFIAGPDLELVGEENELPYKYGGEPHSGVVYLHWWRRSDRFWSGSFIEKLKDPQRIINRRKTQNVELIDRGMPKLIVRKGDWPDTTGAPLEVVELDRNAQQPLPMAGIGPGGWFYQDISSLDDDLVHASTLAPLRLGENPTGVDTFAQLALLNDNEAGKRGAILAEHRERFGVLTELAIEDIRRYWPEKKTALVVGEENVVRQMVFKKSRIPQEFRVKAASGQPLPRSQGAQIKKIDAIWLAALQAGVIVQDPAAWVAWYQQSIDAGQAQQLPRPALSSQAQFAQLENMLLRQGEEVTPAYYDQLKEHLPIHREEEDQARAEGDIESATRIERHIQAHLQLEMENQARLPTAQPPAPPGAPAAPGSPNGNGSAMMPQPSPAPTMPAGIDLSLPAGAGEAAPPADAGGAGPPLV